MVRRSTMHSAAILAMAPLVVSAVPLAAQAHQNPATPTDIRPIQEMTPRSGPPGTEISVYTENLPLQGKVVLGIGAVDSGFEAMAEVEQGALGEVGGSVRVPPSATWEQPLVVILFNGNFAPIAQSDPFHVTNTDGRIRRTGTVSEGGGAGCFAMQDVDGYAYTLTGEVGTLRPGAETTVEGTFNETGPCEGGETIHVFRVASGADDPER